MEQKPTTIEFPAKLTPRASRILERASGVAQDAGVHHFIGVEHIFLAIMDDQGSIPTQVLERLGVANSVRRELLKILGSEAYRGSGSSTG